MIPGDQDDIFHSGNPNSELSGPREPAVDMPDHPFAEIYTRDRVFPLSLYWKA